MFLSDGDIKSRIESGELVVEPISDPDTQFQPCSIDFRLGKSLLIENESFTGTIRPETGDGMEEYLEECIIGEDTDEDEYILHPGEFILGTTIERVEIPDDLVSFVEGRSSIGRIAVTIHSTAGLIDPGYQGQVTLEITNEGNSPVALVPGMRIGQFVFQELKNPAVRPYGDERGSKYQNQAGPQSSRAEDDPEFDSK